MIYYFLLFVYFILYLYWNIFIYYREDINYNLCNSSNRLGTLPLDHLKKLHFVLSSVERIILFTL